MVICSWCYYIRPYVNLAVWVWPCAQFQNLVHISCLVHISPNALIFLFSCYWVMMNSITLLWGYSHLLHTHPRTQTRLDVWFKNSSQLTGQGLILKNECLLLVENRYFSLDWKSLSISFKKNEKIYSFKLLFCIKEHG